MVGKCGVYANKNSENYVSTFTQNFLIKYFIYNVNSYFFLLLLQHWFTMCAEWVKHELFVLIFGWVKGTI